MTTDESIYHLEEMYKQRLTYAAQDGFHKNLCGPEISVSIDQTYPLVQDFLKRNASEKRKAETREKEAERSEPTRYRWPVPPEEVVDEAERAKRQRQCEADITAIAERLRDVNMLIDTFDREEYERTGKKKANSVRDVIRICTLFLWNDHKSVNEKGELVTAYTRKEYKMTTDYAIYCIEVMYENRLKEAAETGWKKIRLGPRISGDIDETYTLVEDFLKRNASEQRKAETREKETKEAKRREEEAKRLVEEVKRREDSCSSLYHAHMPALLSPF